MNSEPNTPILASDPGSDQATMLAAKRGDERASGILFRRYPPKIFTATLRNQHLANELEVQQLRNKIQSELLDDAIVRDGLADHGRIKPEGAVMLCVLSSASQ